LITSFSFVWPLSKQISSCQQKPHVRRIKNLAGYSAIAKSWN
jgi:hypothetical protein